MNRREAVEMLIAGAVGAGAYALCEHCFSPPPTPKTCKVLGTPLDEMHTYLCAFHVGKKNGLQVEAHHYCMPVSDPAGMFQCIIFDANKPGAKILGVEYIISKEMYALLPKEEQGYWHPHDYEVDSGLLVAPKMSRKEEDDFLAVVKGTYGKTFHFINGGSIPLGEPQLQWSFTKDGQIDPKLIEKRDKALGINTEEIRKHRQESRK